MPCTLLLDRGAKVDATDATYQQTALMVAVRENHPDIVKLLIARGAVGECEDARRTDAGVGAARIPCPASATASASSAAVCPIAGDAAPIPGGMTPLLYAARDGRLETVRMLLDAGADIKQPRRQRHHAAHRRDHQQPSRRRALPDRARRRHQGRGLVRPHAALGRGRDAQHGRGQRARSRTASIARRSSS